MRRARTGAALFSLFGRNPPQGMPCGGFLPKSENSAAPVRARRIPLWVVK